MGTVFLPSQPCSWTFSGQCLWRHLKAPTNRYSPPAHLGSCWVFLSRVPRPTSDPQAQSLRWLRWGARWRPWAGELQFFFKSVLLKLELASSPSRLSMPDTHCWVLRTPVRSQSHSHSASQEGTVQSYLCVQAVAPTPALQAWGPHGAFSEC